MAKAKSVVDQLMGLLDADQAAALKARPEFATIQADDAEGVELRNILHGEEPDPAPAAPPTTPPPSTATATATPPPAAAAAPSGNDDIKKMLGDLSTKIDLRLGEMSKKFVSVEDLPKLQGQVNASAAKFSEDYLDLREEYRTTFGKKFERDKFEKFVEEAIAANNGVNPYAGKDGLRKAYNAFTADELVQKKIADGVAEASKAKKSSETVPGQTQETGLSPAQQVTAKARANAGSGQSAAMAAAARLKQIEDQRETADRGLVH